MGSIGSIREREEYRERGLLEGTRARTHLGIVIIDEIRPRVRAAVDASGRHGGTSAVRAASAVHTTTATPAVRAGAAECDSRRREELGGRAG